MNEYNIVFLSDEEGKVYVEIGVYGTNNQPKRENLKYEQRGVFVLV